MQGISAYNLKTPGIQVAYFVRITLISTNATECKNTSVHVVKIWLRKIFHLIWSLFLW